MLEESTMNSTRWIYIFLGIAALAVVGTVAVVTAFIGLDRRQGPGLARPVRFRRPRSAVAG
jgi:hypothetical protein